MMHHTKFLKRCLAQPRLLLRAVVLGMLLTGCFAVMAGFGASMASAQSLTRQNGSPSSPSNQQKSLRKKPANQGNSANQGTPASEASPTSQGTPTSEASPTGQDNQGKNVPVDNKNNTAGSANNAAGSTNSSNGGGGIGGGVPVGGVPVGGAPGGGAGKPGLPFTGSDPYANPLP